MLKTSFVSLSLMLAMPALAVAQEKKAAPSSNGVINVFPNCVQVPGNLIQNCGFESGTFDGWTQSGDTSFTSVTTDAAHSGNFGVKIGPEGFAGFLTQVVPTTAGQRYDLSFWLRNAGQPNQFLLYWGGTLISNCQSFPTTASPGADTIVHDQMFFPALSPARGPNTVLTFGFFNATDFFFFDDVVLVPSPGGAQAN